MSFFVKYDAVIGWVVAAGFVPHDLPGGTWVRWSTIVVCAVNAVLSLRIARRRSVERGSC